MGFSVSHSNCNTDKGTRNSWPACTEKFSLCIQDVHQALRVGPMGEGLWYMSCSLNSLKGVI